MDLSGQVRLKLELSVQDVPVTPKDHPAFAAHNRQPVLVMQSLAKALLAEHLGRSVDCVAQVRYKAADGPTGKVSRRCRTQAARPRRMRAAVLASATLIPNSSATVSADSPAFIIPATSTTRTPDPSKIG